MLSWYNKNRKRWFTLVEVLFVCSIFAIMVVWIILAINRSYVFMNNTRLQVRATNFAREWVEMMFNLRDTNWRKYSWKKDEYRLVRDVRWWSLLLEPWLYNLIESTNDEDIYIAAGMISPSNIDDFYSDEWFRKDEYTTARWDVKIVFTWSYPFLSWGLDASWNRTWTQETWSIKELLWSETDFYRLVRVYGTYKKDTSNVSDTVASTDMRNATPKELRFCVKVFYRTNAPHTSELCSIMTNFEE